MKCIFLQKKRKIAVTGLLEMQQRVFESERNSIPAFQNGFHFAKLNLFLLFSWIKIKHNQSPCSLKSFPIFYRNAKWACTIFTTGLISFKKVLHRAKVESSLAKCLNMRLIRGELIIASIDLLINLNRISIFNYQPIGKRSRNKNNAFSKEAKNKQDLKEAFIVCWKHFNDPVLLVTW